MPLQPEPWQTDAAGPFIPIGDVSVWAIGDQLFRIESPVGVEEVEGFQEARRRARELGRLVDRWSPNLA
jgi:hypothetical protein